MNRLIIFFITFVSILTVQTGVFAGDVGRPVTPYGDFCSQASHYGTHRHMHDHKQVEHALKHYYGVRGFEVDIEEFRGRFIKASVKKEGKVVDRIIFDRRTGRIRSIN